MSTRSGQEHQAGVTLVELMIGSALLVGGTGTLLMAMQHLTRFSTYLSERQFVINAVHGRLEQLASTSIVELTEDSAFGSSRAEPLMMTRVDPLGGSRTAQIGWLTIQIKTAELMNPSNPSILDLHVAACWTVAGRVITGEDVNCSNGTLDSGEDLNGNG